MKVLSWNKIVLLLIVLSFSLIGVAQNCASFITYQTPAYPYKYNGQSKSATCESGKTYKFIVALLQGKDYKLSFYCSSIFDNKINFKIIDESSSKVLIDLPGESDKDDKTGSVLVAPFFLDKPSEYPSFDFHPINSLKLQIIIDVTAVPAGEDIRRGCIGVLIQEKKSDSGGWE
jgi:hypothetical protein